MSNTTIPTGFNNKRSEHMLQEYEHDAYKLKGKLQDPTVCPQCNAVFHEGRWQWQRVPTEAHRETCPACHRIQDHYPAGFLTLQGEFFATHGEEIMNLVHNVEKHERTEHPLKRIMAVEDKKDGGILITTTDLHLARGIGEALHHAYQGELKFHYNKEENLLRVSWTH